MKKLFFFRSQSSTANNNQVSPTSTDKQVYWEKPTEKVDKARRVNKHGSEDQVFDGAPCLRRSRSLSSGSFYDTGKGLRNHGDPNGSPCSTSYYSHKKTSHQSSRSRAPTPERQPKVKGFDAAMIKSQKFDSIASSAQPDLSETSSHCSSNVSSKVLDRYIDGEQQVEMNELKTISSMRNQYENGNSNVKRPPRFQSTQPVSPFDARKQKPKSQSFRETKSTQHKVSSTDWSDNGFCNESPRQLAKNVVERLSQSRRLPKMGLKEYDPNSPITIEDIYSRSLHGGEIAYSDEVSPKNCATEWNSETTDEFNHEESSEFSVRDSSSGDKDGVRDVIDAEMDTDFELLKKFKEAEDRAAFLSEELGREKFLQVRGLSVPVLIQTIRSLTEENVNIALEVSGVLHERITEKTLFKEELKLAREELDAQTRRLEKEKKELQFALEKELDRRSTEWSRKLEKYQAEENRLRERVRELAEQNVGLQREVSSFSEREMETRTKITMSEKQLEALSVQLNETMEENHHMQKKLSELQDKSGAAEEERDCFRRSYQEKLTECKDMHQTISRLQRTCTDQEKTIDGLRVLCEEYGNQNSQGKNDFGLTKVRVEHMRLTGVEHSLRKEVESYRVKVDSLRRENIDLLNRLKNNGKEGTFSTFKLDRELQNRICCLQNEVLPLLKDSNKLGRKLLDYVKTNRVNNEPVSEMGLMGQVLVECEVKLQGVERAAEKLTRSTQTISSVLQEKSSMLHEMFSPIGMESQGQSLGDDSQKRNDPKLEDIIRSELKAEALVTSLLREKLYSNELEMEQLQAELAAAVRGNDVLKCEVQNAMDNFSCVNHNMKDLELQMMKKDEIINRLQGDLQECKKELAVVRGILPKITEERDQMWEDVQRYNEKNMLMDAEINILKKKVERLDEDVLLKEGQIAILKDSIAKPFNLLASPDSIENFC